MAQPVEYTITPEQGDCSYDERSVSTAIKGTSSFVQGVARKYAMGPSILHLNRDTRPSSNNSRDLAGALVSASREVVDAQPRFGRGLTTTYAESVKAVMYKAGLDIGRLQSESFAEPFKAAVIALVNGPSREAAVDFIRQVRRA